MKDGRSPMAIFSAIQISKAREGDSIYMPLLEGYPRLPDSFAPRGIAFRMHNGLKIIHVSSDPVEEGSEYHKILGVYRPDDPAIVGVPDYPVYSNVRSL